MTGTHSPPVVRGPRGGDPEEAVEAEHVALVVVVELHATDDPPAGPAPAASDASAEASELAEFADALPSWSIDEVTPAPKELSRKPTTIPIETAKENRDAREPNLRSNSMVRAEP